MFFGAGAGAEAEAKAGSNKPGSGTGQLKPKPIRVLLVDDDAQMRWQIRQHLELSEPRATNPNPNRKSELLAVASEPSQPLPVPVFTVVGEGTNGLEGLKLIGELSPNVVILDINMPNQGGVGLAQEILKLYPEQKRLVLSSNLNVIYAQMFLHLKVQGYLHKSCGASEVRSAVNAVMNGAIWLSSAIDPDPEDKEGTKRKIAGCIEKLTPTERRYLQALLIEGGSDSHLARYLKTSEHIAARCRARIYEVLGIKNRVELIMEALNWMLVLSRYPDAPLPPV